MKMKQLSGSLVVDQDRRCRDDELEYLQECIRVCDQQIAELEAARANMQGQLLELQRQATAPVGSDAISDAG